MIELVLPDDLVEVVDGELVVEVAVETLVSQTVAGAEVAGNLDGGHAGTNYGGTTPIEGGGA